jgi:ABC-type nitrate/sulfonate/bicarbonate transport system substrate-binding protein
VHASRQRALAALAASPVLLSRAARAQTLPTLRVGSVPSEAVMPLIYGVRSGAFERAGVKVEVTRTASGAATIAAVAGGALDVGVSAMWSIVLGYAHGVPFQLVAPMGLWLPASEGGLLVAASSNLRAPADFVGKTISAAAVNDISDLAMRVWMDQNGADSKSVKVLEIPQSAAQAALEQGRVDGIAVTDPAFAVAMAGGKVRFVANIFSSLARRYLLGGLVSTRRFVEGNRTAVERFSRVIAQTSTYVNTHPDETLGDVADWSGLDRSLLTHMKRTAYSPGLSQADVQPVIDVGVRYKIFEKTFSATDLISDAAVKG